MKVGNHTGYFWYGKEADGIYGRMAEIGYDAADQAMCDIKEPIFHDDEALKQFCAANKAAAARNGITINQLHGPWPTYDTEEESRAEGWRCFHRAVLACHMMEIPYMVFHPQMPYGWGAEEEPELAKKLTIDLMCDLLPDCEKYGVTICLVSLYWEDYLQGDPEGNGAFLSAQIKEIKQSGKADSVIAILHGGQEYGRHRTRPQQVFTKMALGAGADLVICHHAHVVMGMDVIGNRSAVYSLGNFCFGGNKNAYQKTSKKVQDAAPALIVRAVLTFDDEGNYKGQQLTLYPVQTTSVDRNGASEQPNNYQPKFITGPLGAHVLHLMQVDMNYDLKNAQNRELKNIVTAKEEELAAMESSEGMSSLTLPYLPAEE